jgi:hypothetical protein
MRFFNDDSSSALSNQVGVFSDMRSPFIVIHESCRAIYGIFCIQESLRRVLTIFAKLNPGIRYVQGMNEVLAPLFYVFKNDPDQSNAVSVLCHYFLTQKMRMHSCFV